MPTNLNEFLIAIGVILLAICLSILIGPAEVPNFRVVSLSIAV